MCIYVKLKSYLRKIKLLLFPLVLQIWFLECITDKKKMQFQNAVCSFKIISKSFHLKMMIRHSIVVMVSGPVLLYLSVQHDA